MTRDDIIRMAREAGAMFEHMAWVERDLFPVFTRFAALVAAAKDAELRRLHAECNDLAHQLNESNERNGRLKAQRDALLEALKYLDKEFRQHGRQHWPEAVRVGAAIKAVEEGK